MRNIKKPEDSQDVQDEAFLRQHSPHPSCATMSLDQVREKLVKELELAQAGAEAGDQVARAFSLGGAAALRDALKLIDQVLPEQQAARIKAAASGKGQK
jgi:hypothetical protein